MSDQIRQMEENGDVQGLAAILRGEKSIPMDDGAAHAFLSQLGDIPEGATVSGSCPGEVSGEEFIDAADALVRIGTPEARKALIQSGVRVEILEIKSMGEALLAAIGKLADGENAGELTDLVLDMEQSLSDFGSGPSGVKIAEFKSQVLALLR